MRYCVYAKKDAIQIEEGAHVMCSVGGTYFVRAQPWGLNATGIVITPRNSLDSDEKAIDFRTEYAIIETCLDNAARSSLQPY